jgi:YVTN family beta-propeller protein
MKYTTCLLKRYGKGLLVCVAAAVGAAVMLGSTCSVLNKAPTVPVISGPSAGVVGVPVTFKATATDPEGDSIAFQFDWGDSSALAWTNLIVSGETTSVQHTYADSGSFSIKVKAKDAKGKEGDWAGATSVRVIAGQGTYPDSLVGRVQVGSDVGAVVFSVDDQYLYVAQTQDASLLVMSLASLEFVDTVPVGDWPSDLELSPDGAYLYVANLMSGDISVVRTSDNVEVARVPVGSRPESFDLTPDGQSLYVGCRDEDSVAVVDIASRTVTRKFAVGTTPRSVAVLPNGQGVLVCESGDSAVTLFSIPSGNIIASRKLAGRANLVLPVSGDKAYVGSSDGGLTIVSTLDLAVLSTLAVGGDPSDAALSPNGSYAFVATAEYTHLPVIDIASGTVVGQLANDVHLGHVAVNHGGTVVCATDGVFGVYVYEK